MKRTLFILLSIFELNNVYGQVKATTAEINAGIDDVKFTTALGLQSSKYLDQSGAKLYAVTAAGANTYQANLFPPVTSYSEGQVFYIRISTANTGASTLNLNGLGAKAVVKDAATALTAGDLLANKVYAVYYDGLRFQLLNMVDAILNQTGVLQSGNFSISGIGSLARLTTTQVIPPSESTIAGNDWPSGIYVSDAYNNTFANNGWDAEMRTIATLSRNNSRGLQLSADIYGNVFKIRSLHSTNTTIWRTLWHSGNLNSLSQLPTRNFFDLQNRPTTVEGYGITDAMLSTRSPVPVSANISEHRAALSVTYQNDSINPLGSWATTITAKGAADRGFQFSSPHHSDDLYIRGFQIDGSPYPTWGKILTDKNVATATIQNQTTIVQSGGFKISGVGTMAKLMTTQLRPDSEQLIATYDWADGIYVSDVNGHNYTGNGWDTKMHTVATFRRGNTRGLQISSEASSSVFKMRSLHPNSPSVWRTLWHDGNLTSLAQLPTRNFSDLQNKPTTLTGYGITNAPTVTGAGATGNWPIGITGNAATATALANSRTINGISFNGSANITVVDATAVHKTGDETIVGTKSFSTAISIGGTLAAGYKLAVNGGIIAGSVKVKPYSLWPDYVFDKDYSMLSLGDLEKFILRNKHLPDVPAASDVKREGVDLGDMNIKLLRKVEELTLYLIDLKKENEMLKKRLDQLEKK